MAEINLLSGIFIFLLASFLGGILAKFLKLQPFVGYIVAGVLFGSFLPKEYFEVDKLADIGAILLLFSLGLELSLSKLQRILKVALWGGFIQVVLSSALFFVILIFLGVSQIAALILAIGFSLSSTAVVVKLLSERGDLDSIHGELMVGWLLVQDLAVLPIMIIVSSLDKSGNSNWLLPLATMSLKGFFVISLVVVLGRLVLPFIIHKTATLNSRELLLLISVIFALGVASLVKLFGFSSALGAFLAGVVISDSQEKHAVFAETRSLRDLFVALFFVSLGFTLVPSVLFKSILLILFLVLVIFVVKFIVFLIVNFVFGYFGKTAILSSLGLTQVGEFAFIIFSQARNLKILSFEDASLGIAVALVSLVLSPLVFRYSYVFWRKLKNFSHGRTFLSEYFAKSASQKEKIEEISDHIVICGFGRVGRWVGKALDSLGIDFLVIDYNEKAVREARERGIKVIYGDASDIEIIKQARIPFAKCVVIAIPDKVAQEELITHIQTISPNVKIFARAHLDEDAARLRFLRVDKVVQPEFEVAIGIVSSVLTALGVSLPEIKSKIRDLRRSHTISENPTF